MSNLLPIIEQLENCGTHLERAAWLRSCPIDILRRYDSTIRNRLMHASFQTGIDYMDDLRVQMSATRDPATGMFTDKTQRAIAVLGDMLATFAEQDDAARAPTPDHTLTDL